MARPNNDPRDDYDDLPPDTLSRPRSNPATTIILILGGVVLLLVVACAGVGAVVWLRPGPVVPPPAAATVVVDERPEAAGTRRVYDRADFKALILAADRDAVTRAVGAPSKGVELGPPEVWHYAGVTRDPATGKVDFDAAVVFENGRVREVRFKSAGDMKAEEQ